MNLKSKQQELIDFIQAFLEDKIELNKLNDFAWDVIELFTVTSKDSLPLPEDFEKSFWYAIWQIQHLSVESHMKKDRIKKDLRKILFYLIHYKKLPKNLIGNRPIVK